MTDLPIEDLGMTDEEYAQLLTQGYDPELERQLTELGERPTIVYLYSDTLDVINKKLVSL
jgi:hypothetical protein